MGVIMSDTIQQPATYIIGPPRSRVYTWDELGYKSRPHVMVGRVGGRVKTRLLSQPISRQGNRQHQIWSRELRPAAWHGSISQANH